MHLEPEQEELLVRMVEGSREVPRSERQWLLITYGQGGWFEGPGIDGREEGVEADVRMLERAGFIEAIRYSAKQGNPTYVLTPEALAHYRATRESEPVRRQETQLRRFLDAQAFRTDYPKAYARWADAESLLWTADSEREFTTIGHKAREALQEFATEAVERYQPPNPEPNVALVNKRLGAVIAALLPKLGQTRADLLKALGDYSEATLTIVQRQEHGAQKEGERLTWQDARRVVFHSASVMYELAESLGHAARRT